MSDQPRPATAATTTTTAATSVRPTMSAALNVLAKKLWPLVLLVALGFVVWLSRDALAPYLAGLLIIYILLPVVYRIESWIPDKGRLVDLERPIAAFIAIGLAAILAAAIVIILLDPLISQTTALITEVSNYLTNPGSDPAGFQRIYQERVPPEIREWTETNIELIGERIVGGSMDAANWLLSFAGSLVGSIFALIAVPLFIVFYLIDEKSTAQSLRKHLPLIWAEDLVAVFRIADRILGSYTRAVVIQAAIIAIATAAGYTAVGIEMALPLGIIAGAGAVVPIVGLWISLFVTVPVVIATQGDVLVQAVIVYFGVQLVSGWVLMPKIQGQSVDFTVTGVLLIIAIAGAIGGPLGLIFGLPIAAIARAVAVYTNYRLNGDSPETAIRTLPLFQTESDLKIPSILHGERGMEPIPALPVATDPA